MAMLLVPTLADRQRPPLDVEPLARGGGLHYLDTFRNNFEADVVAQQDADLQAHSSTTMPPRAKASCISGTLIAAMNALRSVAIMSAGTADGAKAATHCAARMPGNPTSASAGTRPAFIIPTGLVMLNHDTWISPLARSRRISAPPPLKGMCTRSRPA